MEGRSVVGNSLPTIGEVKCLLLFLRRLTDVSSGFLVHLSFSVSALNLVLQMGISMVDESDVSPVPKDETDTHPTPSISESGGSRSRGGGRVTLGLLCLPRPSCQLLVTRSIFLSTLGPSVGHPRTCSLSRVLPFVPTHFDDSRNYHLNTVFPN